MIIQYHAPTMNILNNMEQRGYRIAKCVQRISSGKRINSAADDPVGTVQAERIKARLRELETLRRINEMKQDMLSEQASEQSYRIDLLQRLRELSVQASSGTYTDEERQVLVNEFKSTLEELLDHMKHNSGLEIRVEDDSGEMYFFNGTQYYVNGEWQDALPGMDISTREGAGRTIGLLDYYMNQALLESAGIGALNSRISHKISLMSELELLLAEQLSRIEDADLAEEMVKLTKETMLQQASTLLLSHVRVQRENVLRLLVTEPMA